MGPSWDLWARNGCGRRLLPHRRRQWHETSRRRPGNAGRHLYRDPYTDCHPRGDADRFPNRNPVPESIPDLSAYHEARHERRYRVEQW